MNDLEDFFWSELHKAEDRQPNSHSDSIFIRCPNVDHSGGMERTPSLRIRTTGNFAGSFKCYGCGWKGHWNDIADILKLQRISAAAHIEKNDIETSSLQRSMGIHVAPSIPRVKDREIPWYEDTNWRGVSGKTLCKVKALLAVNIYGTCQIRFPAFYHGKRVGHVSALMQKPTNRNLTSYIESKPEGGEPPWSEKHVLFFDYARENINRLSDKVFIVEGPRDALRLIENGLIAVSLMGTQKTEDQKIDTIIEINAPKYVIMTDGDRAGDMAGDILHKKMTRRYVSTHRVNLPDGKDPFDLPVKTIKKLSLL